MVVLDRDGVAAPHREVRYPAVVHLYAQHLLGTEPIAELVGRSPWTVLECLKAEGVAIRPVGRTPKSVLTGASCWCDLPERLRERREEVSR